jgi:hypothetical protein
MKSVFQAVVICCAAAMMTRPAFAQSAEDISEDEARKVADARKSGESLRKAFEDMQSEDAKAHHKKCRVAKLRARIGETPLLICGAPVPTKGGAGRAQMARTCVELATFDPNEDEPEREMRVNMLRLDDAQKKIRYLEEKGLTDMPQDGAGLYTLDKLRSLQHDLEEEKGALESEHVLRREKGPDAQREHFARRKLAKERETHNRLLMKRRAADGKTVEEAMSHADPHEYGSGPIKIYRQLSTFGGGKFLLEATNWEGSGEWSRKQSSFSPLELCVQDQFEITAAFGDGYVSYFPVFFEGPINGK